MSYIGNSPGVASQRVTTTLTATAAQTQFTTQSGYVLGYVDVYLNGAKLVNGSDFEAITGTYITLFSGALAGDIVELISYVPRGLSDGYTKAEADAKFLDVGGDTATGNLSFATATLSGDLTLNGSTANGVAYLNGSKVVVAGSALTFNGTVLAAPTLNLTNALGIAYGGTGQTTANAALNALLPAQTGNATKYLQTDGSNATWDAISISTADITGTLPIANGGTGATTAAGALTSLGAYAASNPSGYTTNTGTVTSVGGTGTVNGLTLTGTVSTSGNLTLGGTLDLSAYSAAGAFSTLSASGAVTLSGGTANGVPYLNGSKVVTTGSALTFDGTNLGVGSASYGNAGSINVSVGAPASTIGGLQLWSTTTGNHYVQFGDGTTGSDPYRGAIGYNHNADNLVFYSAGVIGMTLTGSYLYTGSSISVGIGTSNPTAQLEIGRISTSGYSTLRLSNSGTSGRTYEIGLGGNTAAAGYANNLYFYDSTAAVNRMVLTSAGNLGVGTGTADARLTVIGPAAKLYVDLSGDNYYDAANHVFRNFAGTTRASISSDGNFFISSATTNTNSSKLVVNGTISQTVNSTQYLVVDQSDVGTAPNQIPLNQYLGSMAFQDRENVNFSGGTGALSSLDIAAISAQLNVNATSVFVYDTSRDSDGGAWRKRTQHTSWYNETLNTATRGARRDFPAVAVIVVNSSLPQLTIYDGDSPDMPLWISYKYLSWDSPIRKVSAVNGIIAGVIFGASDYSGNGLVLLDFIKDRQSRNYIAGYYIYKNGFVNELLSTTRNDDAYLAIGSNVREYTLSSYNTNDLAMTVLPNAPIDPATGLPVPTIAVATANGVSVIKDNGTVTNLTWSGAALRLSGFNSDNAFCAIYNNGNTIYNVKYKPPYNTQDTSENYYYNLAVAQGPSLPWNPTNEKPLWGRKNEYVIGTTGVLRYLGEGIDGVPATRTYNVQTSTYNSGYMVGDIKGAWLSDTTQETVIGTELITNGTFDSSTTGWSTYPGYTSTVLSIDTNRLKVFGGGAQQSFSTVIGKKYVLSYTLTAFNPGGVYLGTESSGVGGFSYFSTGSQGTGTYIYTFTATSTTAYLGLFAWNAGSEYAFYDNVSVRLADIDRSPNYKGLQVFGTITKTPVATGADLVAYSGFTDNDYLHQDYNSASDIGTGNFSVSGWFRTTDATAVYRGMFYKNTLGAPGGKGIQILMDSSNKVYGYIYGTAMDADVVQPSGLTLNDGVWHQVVFTSSNNNYHALYIDGKLLATNNNTVGSLTNTAAITAVGTYKMSNASYYWRGDLALWRFSLSAPTADQVAKMYNDEKYLFQPNAKATLYGTSDAVTALAYDTDTQLLHVGTSSGRSVFDGLRRVDNTTTAVATAISAVDGLVVEN